MKAVSTASIVLIALVDVALLGAILTLAAVLLTGD